MKLIKGTILRVAIVATLSSCSSNADTKMDNTAVNVEVYYPTKVAESAIFVSGSVSAKQTAIISTRMMGFVDKVFVNQGDKVNKGQLLMVVNSDDLKSKKAQVTAMLMEAEAAAKNASRDYERFKALHHKKSVSDKELENVELLHTSMHAKVEVAREALHEVNAMLAYSNITAPFAGVVTQRMIDQGSTTNPGMPLLLVEQAGDLEVKASVPEGYVEHITIGEPVKMDIKSVGKQLNGVISELSPSSSFTGGQYAIKVEINEKDKEFLKSGMYAGIYLPVKTQQSGMSNIWIDRASVVARDQLTGVYVASGGENAVLHWVRLGKEIDGQVEVLSGLNEKDRVIRKADGKLYNGQKIKVIN